MEVFWKRKSHFSAELPILVNIFIENYINVHVHSLSGGKIFSVAEFNRES